MCVLCLRSGFKAAMRIKLKVLSMSETDIIGWRLLEYVATEFLMLVKNSQVELAWQF